MNAPAVPRYVVRAAEGFADCPAGHRFSLYFPVWTSQWEIDKKGGAKADSLRKSLKLGSAAKALEALNRRQKSLAEALSADQCFILEARSTSPFATGLGREHPIENGFAFLSPYGLPYLAGSGVKGVLRRAAEELALFPEEYDIAAEAAPTMLDVWRLFGFEGAAGAWWSLTRKEEGKLSAEQKAERAAWKARFDAHLQTFTERPDLVEFIRCCYPAQRDHAPLLDDPVKFLREIDTKRQEIHTRGVLDCWDVFPVPPKGEMAVEIMTPHFSDYYQGNSAPHDAGKPNPIPFLAVPAGSQFRFVITCEPTLLTDAAPHGEWTTLIRKIIDHAFDWLGFGAKTAVGYGAMEEDQAEKAMRESQEAAAQADAWRKMDEARRATLSPEERAWEVHEPQIAVFRQQFETARSRPYQPGSVFDNQRVEFMKLALSWADARSRQAAGEVLRQTMNKDWGTPGKKESKQRIKDAIEQLMGQK